MLCIFLKKLTLSIPRLNAHELSSNVKSSPILENKSTFIVAMWNIVVHLDKLLSREFNNTYSLHFSCFFCIFVQKIGHYDETNYLCVAGSCLAGRVWQ